MNIGSELKLGGTMATQMTAPRRQQDRPGNGGGRVAESAQAMFKRLRSQLHSKDFRDRVAANVPAHLRTNAFVDRFAESVFTACRDNPDLLTKCDPGSLFHAAARIAKKGLTVGDNMAWLVPYLGQVQDQLGWKGALTIVRRSGVIGRVSCHPAFENDKLFIRLGDDPSVQHEPVLDGDPGSLRGVYSSITLRYPTGNEVDVEWMPTAQIDYIRSRAPSKNSPAWQHWKPEMGRAKVIKRHCKRLPIEDDIADQLKDMDDVIEVKADHVSFEAPDEPVQRHHHQDDDVGDEPRGLAHDPDPEAGRVAVEDDALPENVRAGPDDDLFEAE